MTYLQLVKKLGLTKLIICLFDEFGYSDETIATHMKITKPTIHNAKNSLSQLSDALKVVETTAKVNKIVKHITKDMPVPEIYGNPDINKIIDSFKTQFGTTNATRYDRFAAHRLAKKYGADEIVKIIEVLRAHLTDDYCPVIGSVSQLDRKIVNVMVFFKRVKEDERIIL